MKIFINYECNKKIINTKNYQSITSIINQYIIENNINEDIDDYYLDYNGMYLNRNFSLEKYEINEESILNLHTKKRGGSNFFSFAMKNPFLVFIVFIIAFLPVLILPLGFIPATATLIKIIIEKSVDAIGKYLVCTLGKITLFKRLRFLLTVNKYLTYAIMIFVIITFPLILLCVTLKGNSITDNPRNMCGAISAGNTAGIILTCMYMGIYLLIRAGNLIIKPLIYIFKQNYISNMLFNPLLKYLLKFYDSMKYLPVVLLPFIGQGTQAYFTFLGLSLTGLKIMLNTISDIGCKSTFSKEAFIKKLMTNINKEKKNQDEKNKDILDNKSKDNQEEINNYGDVFTHTMEIKRENVCRDSDGIKCCDPQNYINIADTLTMVIENGISSKILKMTGIFPSFILFTEALYESALSRLDANNDLQTKEFNEKKLYLRKILQDKINKISEGTKELIKKFLENGNENLIHDIKRGLEKNFPSTDPLINQVKGKLAFLEDNMIRFSVEDGSKYVPGKSLFKTIFKIIFVDVFCNVAQTTKTSLDVIHEMGEMEELVDMLKGGTSAGIYTGMVYLLTVIILIILGIFNMF